MAGMHLLKVQSCKLKTGTAMNRKISVFVISVERICNTLILRILRKSKSNSVKFSHS